MPYDTMAPSLWVMTLLYEVIDCVDYFCKDADHLPTINIGILQEASLVTTHTDSCTHTHTPRVVPALEMGMQRPRQTFCRKSLFINVQL